MSRRAGVIYEVIFGYRKPGYLNAPIWWKKIRILRMYSHLSPFKNTAHCGFALIVFNHEFHVVLHKKPDTLAIKRGNK